MKRVTIYDVARQANVSLATVSRVMNGSDVLKRRQKRRLKKQLRPWAINQML